MPSAHSGMALFSTLRACSVIRASSFPRSYTFTPNPFQVFYEGALSSYSPKCLERHSDHTFVCGTTYELIVGGHGRSALRSEGGAKGVMQTTSPRSSKKVAPNTCGWHHADAEQASSEEDIYYEHLTHQGPRGHRRFQGGTAGHPNRCRPEPEDQLRVARGSRLRHRSRWTSGVSRSHHPPECRVRG